MGAGVGEGWEALIPTREPIFGRITDRPYGEMGAVAGQLLSGPLEGNRAVAHNLIHDHRVSEERASHFFDLVSQEPVDGARLQVALEDYLKDRVRPDPTGTFLDRGKNGDNFITEDPDDNSLAHVLDLSGLTTVLRWGARRGMLAGFASGDRVTDPEIEDFLGRRLAGEAAQREATVSAILAVLRACRTELPWNPSWVTAWTHFEGSVTTEPESWAEAVGMARATPARWLIVLRYQTEEVGQLVRPTQLDAGWYSFHFPSPPYAPTRMGGHPMSLRDGQPMPDPVVLLPEYILEQIEPRLEHWVAGGRRCDITRRTIGTRLKEYRDRHYGVLARAYGPENIERWMISAAT